MKLKPNPIQTEHHSKIILLLSEGEKSLTDIAGIMNKEVSTISEHMYLLIKEGFVLKDDKPKDKIKNSKSYSLNWNKILSEFLNYISIKAKKELSTPLTIKMKINPYLKEILVRALKDHAEVFKKRGESKTIENLFEKITMQIIYALPPQTDLDLIELSKKKNYQSLKSFLDFTTLLSDYLAADLKDTIEDFYEDIRTGRFNQNLITKKNN